VEYIIEILVEVLIEVYMELMMLIVPEDVARGKKGKIIAFIMAMTSLILVCALIILGVYLITDKNNMAGIIPIAFAVLISAVQIGFGLFSLYKKK
jgi:hypothetical protein